MLGTSGAASARGRDRDRDQENDDGYNGTRPNVSKRRIDTEEDAIVTIVEVYDKTFLFREAEQYRNSDDTSTQSIYEATKSGHPLEFGEIDSAVSASDISRDGRIVSKQVDFTPENYIEDYDADFKEISDSCGDIAFSNHNAIEMHVDGGGAASAIGVSGLGGLVCFIAGAAGAIPTAGWGGFVVGGACSALVAAVDQAIDVEMIPNETSFTVSFRDEDEEYPLGLNTSPTMKVGLTGGYNKDWDEMSVTGEFDQNLHIPG